MNIKEANDHSQSNGSIIWRGLADGRSQEQIASGWHRIRIAHGTDLADVNEFIEQLRHSS